jgi:dihydroorotate dehydrogenase electron transfer subunit
MNTNPANQFTAEVIANEPLCVDHFRLELRVAGFPPSKPGQFIQITCHDRQLNDSPAAARTDRVIEWSADSLPHLGGVELQQPVTLIRRPFSIGGRRGERIDIIHRVVGVGTRFLASLRPGDEVEILGPLGNAFTLPQADELAILVGGGVGIPPMIYLAAELSGRRAVAFAGALRRELVPLKLGEREFEAGEFARHNIPAIVSTDDGSFGFRGFVTQALEEFLDGRLAPRHRGSERCVIYTCGPEAMMKRVADIALRRGIACQVAVERDMACGMGTCQSCCIRVKKPDPAKPPLPGKDWCYRLACTDGPIFQADQLLW